MIYVLFAAVAVLSTVLVGIPGMQKGVIALGKKSRQENIDFYTGKSLILLTMICIVCGFAIQICIYSNTSMLNLVKLYGLYIIVFSAGLIDGKRRIIPNLLIIIGLIFRLGIYVYEIFFSYTEIKPVLINDLIGFSIGFLLPAAVSLLTKGALGFGDAKLFGVIGLLSGPFCTYSTLLVSLVISSVVAVIGVARKKLGRKDAFPFGPCITAGYIIVLLLGSY